MAIIKTPDQRVRVFISSTINELADERKAAREAISNLRLTPVFFEAGARPHPPRDLYSAYLEQSHIFLGIYWNSYGWVAPGAEISGLEDEYRLCGNKKPKLIYVKNSDTREVKLAHLLKNIQDSDTACYQKFSDAGELKTLIENDLSVLMSETFENALVESQSQTNENILAHIQKKVEKKIELPIIKTDIIGRDTDIKNVCELIQKPAVSLVNILGAGGTGKTTLSIHIAHQLKENFADGVLFIPLAPVTDSKLVASTIAAVLDLQDSGKVSVEQMLTDYLIDKNMLLVLDNFEQIVEASNIVSNIITTCPDIKIIITSRATLHIRGENIYHLSPLEIPGDQKNFSEEQFMQFPAVELFITRAKEVNQSLHLTEENKSAIATICNKLEGLPLAIELAASRTKLFQPSVLLQRMDKLLDLTSKGQRDLPERQQTLRNAIEWSYNLLDEESKKVFRILGAFKRSWTLEAADAIINSVNDTFIDIEDVTEKLLDVSLIKPVLVSHAHEPRFNMLQTVHEFANEILDVSNEAAFTKLKFAEYFFELFSGCEDELWYANAETWLDKIEYEFQNIRAAFYIFIQNKLYEKAWKLFYLLVPYWHIRGGYSEADAWMQAAKIQSVDAYGDTENMSEEIKGKTYLWSAFANFFMLHIMPGFEQIRKAEEIFRTTGDKVSLCNALAMDGSYGVYMQFPDAEEKIKEAEELLAQIDNPYAEFTVSLWPYQYYIMQGKHDEANKKLEKAYNICLQHNMRSLIPFFTILKGGQMYMENKFEEAAEAFLNGLNKLPEKGLKGFRGGFILGYAQCLWKLGKLDEAEKLIPNALDTVRESGDKEALFHTIMNMCEYFAMKNEMEKAAKCFGAAETFIELANYPLMGPSEHAHSIMVNLFSGLENNSQQKQWFEEGKKMSLEETIVFIMKE